MAAFLLESKLGAEGRKDLFEWLSKKLSQLNDFPDAVQLLKAAAVAMTVFLTSFFCYFMSMVNSNQMSWWALSGS